MLREHDPCKDQTTNHRSLKIATRHRRPPPPRGERRRAPPGRINRASVLTKLARWRRMFAAGRSAARVPLLWATAKTTVARRKKKTSLRLKAPRSSQPLAPSVRSS